MARNRNVVASNDIFHNETFIRTEQKQVLNQYIFQTQGLEASDRQMMAKQGNVCYSLRYCLMMFLAFQLGGFNGLLS